MKGNKTTNWWSRERIGKRKKKETFFFALCSRTDWRQQTQMITNGSCYYLSESESESKRKERRKLVCILGWGSILLLLLLGSPGDQCNFNDVQSQFQNHFFFIHILSLCRLLSFDIFLSFLNFYIGHTASGCNSAKLGPWTFRKSTENYSVRRDREGGKRSRSRQTIRNINGVQALVYATRKNNSIADKKKKEKKERKTFTFHGRIDKQTDSLLLR